MWKTLANLAFSTAVGLFWRAACQVQKREAELVQLRQALQEAADAAVFFSHSFHVFFGYESFKLMTQKPVIHSVSLVILVQPIFPLNWLEASQAASWWITDGCLSTVWNILKPWQSQPCKKRSPEYSNLFFLCCITATGFMSFFFSNVSFFQVDQHRKCCAHSNTTF